MSRWRFIGGFSGRSRARVASLVVLLVAACSSSSSPTEPNPAASEADIEFRLLQLIHAARGSAGVAPALEVEGRLSTIAGQRSRDTHDLGFFGHVDPDGTTLRQRLEAGGVGFSRAAENIAQVTGVPDPAVFAHELLMDSDQHRANILDDRFSLVGIGVARSDSTVWVTQVFIRS